MALLPRTEKLPHVLSLHPVFYILTSFLALQAEPTGRSRPPRHRRPVRACRGTVFISVTVTVTVTSVHDEVPTTCGCRRQRRAVLFLPIVLSVAALILIGSHLPRAPPTISTVATRGGPPTSATSPSGAEDGCVSGPARVCGRGAKAPSIPCSSGCGGGGAVPHVVLHLPRQLNSKPPAAPAPAPAGVRATTVPAAGPGRGRGLPPHRPRLPAVRREKARPPRPPRLPPSPLPSLYPLAPTVTVIVPSSSPLPHRRLPLLFTLTF